MSKALDTNGFNIVDNMGIYNFMSYNTVLLMENMMSPKWWQIYLIDFWNREPLHVLTEAFCFILIIYLLFVGTEAPIVEKLSKKEEEELIAEWKPESLVPPEIDLDSFATDEENILIVDSVAAPVITAEDGQKYANFASCNFLGMTEKKDIKEAVKATICKYGVGSCGPRGFYGTIDVHLDLESRFAEFMGAPDCILYSDGLACVSSVIPAFCKKNDLIICDEGVNFGIQQGMNLSRSNVLYFKHNDMEDLKRTLNSIAEKEKSRRKNLTRRFIVVEGIYQYYGDMAPLKRIVELCNQFKYRVILDDSMAFGVLGKSGRGSVEHWGLRMDQVDIWCCTMDASLASVGGVCLGNKQVIDHQRLSGAGYCFSAASPPYTATAAIEGINILEKQPGMSQRVRDNASFLHTALQQVKGVIVSGDDISPIKHIRSEKATGDFQKDTLVMKEVQAYLLKNKMFVSVAKYLPSEAERPLPPASIKIIVTSEHSKKDMQKLADLVKAAFSGSMNAKTPMDVEDGNEPQKKGRLSSRKGTASR